MSPRSRPSASLTVTPGIKGSKLGGVASLRHAVRVRKVFIAVSRAGTAHLH
ncbi:hypothetical protein AB4Z46_02665 [Variovorax sp. M-6]|uniref:hypothetical protein n=1 Tax=Variovorax sp. M-6 TaxID=3233041 RepID=UPI003F982A8E